MDAVCALEGTCLLEVYVFQYYLKPTQVCDGIR